MSLGLIPIFSGPAPAFDGLGETLAQELEALEAVAASASLTPLSAFGDQRQVPEDFDGAPEDLDDVLGPCTDWFDPAAGSQAVGALIDAVGRSPSGIEDPAALAGELRALRACLDAAALAGAKFRLTLA